jgi:hypothetical protein
MPERCSEDIRDLLREWAAQSGDEGVQSSRQFHEVRRKKLQSDHLEPFFKRSLREFDLIVEIRIELGLA